VADGFCASNALGTAAAAAAVWGRLAATAPALLGEFILVEMPVIVVVVVVATDFF
jgi:hypothetical protein